MGLPEKSTQDDPISANVAPASLRELLEGFRARHGRLPSVLIIDDDIDVGELLAMQVGNMGLETRTAANGRIGLTEIQQGGALGQSPDLILTDLNMPELGGIALTQELRKMPAHRTTPVVMLTGDIQPELDLIADELGVRHRLGKPFESVDVKQVIQDCLSEILAR